MLVELVSPSTSVLWAAVVRRPWISSGGQRRRQRPRAAAIDDQPLAAVRHLERQGRGRALRGHLLRRRRRRVEHNDRAERRHPLIAPAARLAERPRAKPATFDQRGQPRRFAGAAALPARQRAVAQRDAVERGERSRRGGLDAFGNVLLGGVIAGAQQAEAVDQLHLLERRAADQPAIVELGGRQSARARPASPRATRGTPPCTSRPAATTPHQAVTRFNPDGALSALESRWRAPRARVLSNAER